MWRSVLFAWIVLSALIGCTTTIDVVMDEHANFARYSTWDWLPRHSSPIHAPFSNRHTVNERLSGLIELALQARGFSRDRAAPDFLVDYELAIERELVEVAVTPAMQEISSFKASGSYKIQVSTRELRTYETGRLLVSLFRNTGGNSIWRGILTRRVRDRFEPDLEIAVEKLVERLPTQLVAVQKPGAPRTTPLREPLQAPRILSADARSLNRSPDSPQ